MQQIPNEDQNIYRLLDFVGSLNQKEIDQFRGKLEESEVKIYDVCVGLLSKQKDQLKDSFRHVLDALHGKSSNAEDAYELACDDYFCEWKIRSSPPEGIIKKVKEASQDSAVFSSIMGKMPKQSEEVKEDLSVHFGAVKECEEVFDDYMHRIFLTTNEGNHDKVLDDLKKEALIGNTVVDEHGGSAFIAVSGFCGLNLASVRGEDSENADEKIDALIVLDRSSRVEAFWKEMKEIIVSSETRHEVIAKLEKLVETDLFKGVKLPSHIKYDPLTGLREEILKGTSWLSTTRRFNKIKEIFVNNRFIFKRVDVTDRESMQSLKEAIQNAQLKVDALYVSNIAEYLKPDEAIPFKEGMRLIAQNNTLVVDTAPRPTKDAPLKQRVVREFKIRKDTSFCTSPFCIVPVKA